MQGELLNGVLKSLAFYAALGLIALGVWYFYGRNVSDESTAVAPTNRPFVCEERMPAIVCEHIDDNVCVDAYITHGIRGDDLEFFCR
ncbi:MAG TPA: hypothetical protein VMR52_11215 [Dehalococcoidia bacterium]|nr:hypothetical protein [Dehalococcoidia bacterium]